MRKKFLILATFMLAFAFGITIAGAQAPQGAGWWAGFTVQNAAGADINVNATAYHVTGGDATQYSASVNLQDGFAVTFHPGLAGTCGANPSNGCRIDFNPPLPAGFEGSVVISSDGPAVALAIVNNNASGSVGASGGTARAGYQGTAGTIADTTLYFPAVKRNFAGQSTAFFVQAAGAAANVTIDYTMNDGGTYSENRVIEANKMYVFLPSAARDGGNNPIPSCGGSTGSNCLGGAIVTSDVPVAGTVVEYQEGVSVAEFVLSTRGLTTADIGPSVVVPAMKNNFFGGTTGAAVLNTSNSDITVNLDFAVTGASSGCANSTGDTTSDSITVPAGGSTVVSAFRGNIGGLDDCTFFAMTATSANGANIAVTVNEQRTVGNDTLKAVYTGFNTANATDTIFYPVVKENFFSNTTALTIVNASGSDNVTADVTYSGTTGTHVLRTRALDNGEAVTLRQVFNGPSNNNFSVVSGGLPSANNRYAVTAVSSSGGGIVGLSQEATTSGTTLDISNIEGFNQ